MEHERYLKPPVLEDLKSKMVFVGGPRQVGKTTLALGLLKNGGKSHPAYLNWDVAKHRRAILRNQMPSEEPFLIFDEIHKFARWRGFLKGLYDQLNPEVQILVTGSARLDHYRKGGDSLQGRYHYYRLHPFTLTELSRKPARADAEHLMKFGGFPEPCLEASERTWRRWQRERAARILYEDLRDLERVREVSLIEILLDSLPARVGSPLSIRSLCEDLQAAHETVEHWISILEHLYVCFRISPFGAPKIRAVKKERKLYFWDWSQAPEGGARFENMLACHLLKFCHFREDTEGFRMELRFIRDTDKREIDFVVLQDGKPLFAVECKSGEKGVNPAIRYYRERTRIPAFYQTHLGTADHGHAGKTARVLPFHVFCQELELP
jgi:predicted AAA+ superfamily ATPase